MNLQHLTTRQVYEISEQAATDVRRSAVRDAFDEGAQARREGRPAGACDYPQHSERRAFWLLGHGAQPGGRYNVAGQRKRLAADAHPFAPGVVEAHRAPPSRLTRVLAWLYVAVVAAALLAAVVIVITGSAS